MKHISLLCLLLFCTSLQIFAQGLLDGKEKFTKGDTLRGSLNDNRSWFDVFYYDLNIKVNPETKTIEGYNDIHFTVLQESNTMQLDLFENLNVDKIILNEQELKFDREYNAVIIKIPETLLLRKSYVMRFYYSGKPTIAKRAPWDGGFVWETDKNGKPFIGVACQGLGASVWWPNKDHQSEEPDSMGINCAIPDSLGLRCIANGQNRGTEVEGDWKWHKWFVSYPINNYDVSINIADYTYFGDKYISTTDNKDTLDLNYYVLTYNLDKAKKQFEQVKPMMKCYEKHLGPYPFWRDGFALIETPYLGMEHQSGIAYGNGYKTGYAGSDFSGIGLEFDYIIIHEAGHEWWGNSITTEDIADLWIHEGFCTYTEAIYVECMHGYETAMDYVNAKKKRIGNKDKIIGIYGLNREGSGDMYNKGMLLLNTVRHTIGDDELWWNIIKGITTDYAYSIVTTKKIEDYINEKTPDVDLSKVFEQYLRNPKIPTLQYKINKKGRKTTVSYKWDADVKGFNMPVMYYDRDGKVKSLTPSSDKWQTTTIKKLKPKNFKWAKRLQYYKLDKQ